MGLEIEIPKLYTQLYCRKVRNKKIISDLKLSWILFIRSFTECQSREYISPDVSIPICEVAFTVNLISELGLQTLGPNTLSHLWILYIYFNCSLLNNCQYMGTMPSQNHEEVVQLLKCSDLEVKLAFNELF